MAAVAFRKAGFAHSIGSFRKLEPVAIDGRMLPHEWIESGLRFIKTDGLDHHANHFLPGCQDIAWDLAGTMTEFGLDRGQSEQLIARYEALSGDRGTAARLPFYRVAYLRLAARVLQAGRAALPPGPDRPVLPAGVALRFPADRRGCPCLTIGRSSA